MDVRRAAFALACALLFGPSSPGASQGAPPAQVSDTTWVDHDEAPIRQPPPWVPNNYSQIFRLIIADPLAHLFDIPDKLIFAAKPLGVQRRREAANVNAFDEVPNSSWFTNRNHVRAIPAASLRLGPDSTLLPEKPWVIKGVKHGGASAGFQIQDAAGRHWLVKLDWQGFPQLSSGADMVARTLLHAAGYNVPHNEPVRFVRGDLSIDPDLLHGTKKVKPFGSAQLDEVLSRGAILPDGSYSAMASLFVPGHVLGGPSLRRRRPGDGNDWYSHPNRRELRGLYVLCSWIGYWDTKDENFLDTFMPSGDSTGYVVHYLLDPGSSLGADANGQKRLPDDYEYLVDFGRIARRIATFGFVEDPWRRAKQETGIPSVGRFESAVFDPGDYRPEYDQPAFREMTDGDGYWGAKIVASFSDAQIQAAVQAAHYDDPRATEFLTRNLIQRRDKIARYWFGRVAPLDFFHVDGNALRFHDLEVDVGLAASRTYDGVVTTERNGGSGEHVHLDHAELPLQSLGSDLQRAQVLLSIAGVHSKPVRVTLERRGGVWEITRVRHG